jgi:hypothetical protein
MKLSVKVALICGLLFAPPIAAFAQSGPATTPPYQQWRLGLSYKQAAPYCGTNEMWSGKTETLPDGTKTTHTVLINKSRVCRDSLGRGRVEYLVVAGHPAGQISASKDNPSGVSLDNPSTEIYDPVEGVLYYVDSVHRTARRMIAPAQALHPKFLLEPCSAEDPIALTTKIELLGTQIIEGLMVEGSRCRPIKSEHWSAEYWFSHELDEMIMIKHGDFVSQRLTNIDRSEPDPSLFRIPADYTIEDAADPLAH